MHTSTNTATPRRTDPEPTGGRLTISRGLATAFGLFLVAHGAAHVVGALEMWGLRHDDAALSMETAIRYDGAAATLMGIAWCLVLVAMVCAGGLVLIRHARAARALTVATVVSLAICVAGLPTAFIGVTIDVVVLIALAVMRARQAGRWAV